MKFRDLFILTPIAFGLLACSPSQSSTTADPNAVAGGSNVAPATSVATTTTTTTTTTGSSGTSGATGTGTTTTASGCVQPQYPSRSIYSYALNGTGSNPVTTSGVGIIADNKLRVSITPNAAGNTNGTGGTANYNSMSANVHLLANGVEVGMFTVPAQGGSSGYSTGSAVGQKTNPTAADFSSYLQSGTVTYTIRVDNVRTDYKCNSFCTAQYYGCSTMYCGYYGYAYNWDYHNGNWTCCPGTIDILNQCQRQQCGVGTVLDNSTWSLTVQVETDSTPCITP